VKKKKAGRGGNPKHNPQIGKHQAEGKRMKKFSTGEKGHPRELHLQGKRGGEKIFNGSIIVC